jgi:hypothetical protein
VERVARVLAVDDERDVLDLVVGQLRTAGHPMIGVTSAAEALGLTGSLGPPDVAVVDHADGRRYTGAGSAPGGAGHLTVSAAAGSDNGDGCVVTLHSPIECNVTTHSPEAAAQFPAATYSATIAAGIRPLAEIS